MTKNSEDGDTRLEQSLRTALRDSEIPDAVVRARLSAARARAIDGRRRSIAWPWAALGGAVAASLLAAVIALQPPGGTEAGAPHDDVAQSDLFELLIEDDDPLQEAELYEDLDVLTWLAGEDERA